MSVNERIRQVRKVNGLTLEKFGSRISITKGALSQLENGRANPSDQTIILICREFNVSEKWLRTGEGEMYESKDPDALGDYLKERGVTELEEEIIRTWMELPPKTRRELLEHFQQRLANRKIPMTVEREETQEEHERRIFQGMTRAERHEELDRQLDEQEKEMASASSPSSYGSASGGGKSA